MDFGTCTLHSWNDAPDDEAEPKMGRLVNDKVEPLGPQPTRNARRAIDLLWDRDGVGHLWAT